jgi:TolA-binding protein
VIQENLGVDSNTAPLSAFARAELLGFRHLYAEAETLYDSVLKAFPSEPLADDVYYQKALLRLAQRDYSSALNFLAKVYTDYSTEVLADDALFKAADIWEEKLKNTSEASKLYEKIIIDYPGSTFTVEARKRFRKIRGDKVE